jgi:TP901 family phage tail tape measure protein
MSEKLIVEVLLDPKTDGKSFDNIKQQSQKAGKTSATGFSSAFGGAIGSSLKKIGGKLAVFATAALGVKAFADQVAIAIPKIREFERALAEVNSILPQNEKLTKKSTDTFREFAGEFATSSSNQAKAFYSIVSAGIKGTAKQLDVLEASNKAAIAGLVDIDSAAKVLVSSINSYATSGLTATEISDKLFVAVREGQTTFGELADFIGNVAPVASSAGLKFEELAGAIAGITKAGIKTDIAVTGIRALLSSLIKVTPQAAEEAKKLGIEFSTAALRSKGLVGFLRDLQTATNGNEVSLGRLFPNVRALTPILQVVNGDFEDFARIQNEVKNSLGATTLAADEVKKSLDFKLEQASANFALLRQEIAGLFTPSLGEAAQSLTKLIQSFRTAVPESTKIKNRISDLNEELETLNLKTRETPDQLTRAAVAFSLAKNRIVEVKNEITDLNKQLAALANQKIVEESPFEQLKKEEIKLRSFNQELSNFKIGIGTRFEFAIAGDISETESKIAKLKEEIFKLNNPVVEDTEEEPKEAKEIEKFKTLTDVGSGILDGFSKDIFKKVDTVQDKIKQANDTIGKFTEKTGLALRNGIGVAAGGAFAELGRALQSGENAVEAFGKAFLKSIGDTLVQQGTAFILEGTAYAFSANPLLTAKSAGLISAGAAMATFGGVLGSAVSPQGGSGSASSATTGVANNELIQDSVTDPIEDEDLERQTSTSVNIQVEGSLVQQEELGSFISKVISESNEKSGNVILSPNFA